MSVFYKITSVVLGAACLTVMGALPLHAQQDVAQDNRPFWETEKVPAKLVKRYERRYPFFKKLDKDQNWILSEAEIEAAISGEFKAFDKDLDGIWNKEEFTAYRSKFVETREESHGATSADRVKRFDLRVEQADKNDDGQLSWEEFYRFSRERYFRMDNNKNGEIEFKEFRTIDDKISPTGGSDDEVVKVPEYKDKLGE